MLRPFSRYRNTELEWLETLPVSWSMLRTKQMFCLRTEKAPQNNQFELLSVYTRIGVKPRKDLEQRGNKASTTDGYWIVHEGDIICNKLLAWMGAVGVSHYQGVTSPAYDILQPIQSCDTDYYHYVFRTPIYLQQFKIRSRGIMDMRLRLYFDQLGQIPIPVPSVDEQKTIVAFLNWKSSLISKFIYNKRRLIEVLKEQKQNIINQVVMRGINSNVKFRKCRDIELPKEWEVKRLKYLVQDFNMQTDQKQSNEVYIALEHVESWSGKISLPNEEVLFESKVKRFCTDDILFGKLRPYLAKVTRPQVSGVCVGEFLVLRNKSQEVLSEFIELKLRSKQIINMVNSSTFGAKMPRADWTFIGNIRFAYPSITEQEKIISFIKEKSFEIDQAIYRAESEINLIREYRVRLISDVVLGRVNVRDITVPEITNEVYNEIDDDINEQAKEIEVEENLDEAD